METEIELVKGEPHHHGSHRNLADIFDQPSVPGGSGTVDAIVVPTIRHPRWLTHAGRLAAALGRPLVTLHSKWSSAREAAAWMPPDVRFIAVDIGEAHGLNLPDFRTTALLKDTPFARPTDLGAKRNTGLLLARLMGWERIIFLDDDIVIGGHEEVTSAAALLEKYDVVGMHIGGYPDNSVVCHAHRFTGGHQESFVGGGALAVKTTCVPSFFPNIYNEDWFYLLGETSLRPLAVTGNVRQRPYDPFDRPIRARDQELGDVLAEGIYWLLDGQRRTGWTGATEPAHWADFLARRKHFIEDVLGRVRRLPVDSAPNRHAMESSLVAALGRLRLIDPALCVSYVKAWTEDRRRWADHFEKIPNLGPDTAVAMKWLIKADAKPLFYRAG
ncbi:hypothetical protein ITP53_21780 [Nonomuraea sp. K274]|uniref:Uncharacterized protein n=1 Tax=Nonomuraea cypriaca TaxID=1187855 RepID=A0A931EY16_9ACTN|nr:hypothetical protein [Nonomuraea cypriaca]MBF8188314.1 hypothetical protein [Nonomuraea cypriaca]